MTALVKLILGAVALLTTVGILVAAVPSFDSAVPTAPVPLVTLQTTNEPIPEKPIEGDEAKVIRVVDGDTFELEDGKKVRMIGVDTPETVDPRKSAQCFGKEASNKTKELLEGKTVRLVKDVSDTDRHQRLLRYVYVGDTFINDSLVREGFAKSSSYPPDIKLQDQFRESEEYARTNKKGLWATGACESPTASPTIQPITTKAPTSTQTTTKAPASTKTPTGGATCSANTYNCSDFSTCSEAKAVYNMCSTDVHGLDRDGDGIPCDTICQ